MALLGGPRYSTFAATRRARRPFRYDAVSLQLQHHQLLPLPPLQQQLLGPPPGRHEGVIHMENCKRQIKRMSTAGALHLVSINSQKRGKVWGPLCPNDIPDHLIVSSVSSVSCFCFSSCVTSYNNEFSLKGLMSLCRTEKRSLRRDRFLVIVSSVSQTLSRCLCL